MALKDLSTLKQMLLDANATIDDFMGVMKFFFKNVAHDPACAGARTTNKVIDGVLGWLAGQMFPGQDISKDGTPVEELANYHFIQCAFDINGMDGTAIYFTDVGKGLIAIAWTDGETGYMPFTASGPFTGGGATRGFTTYRRAFDGRAKQA